MTERSIPPKLVMPDIGGMMDDIFRVATIRRRGRGEAPLSDATCTPKWLADRLPIVDVDPASNFRSHIRARWSFSLEKFLDGLKLPWRGSVFLNHPYSKPMPWIVKLIEELTSGRCTDAIVLSKMDSSPRWWDLLTQAVARDGVYYYPDLWLFKKRIQFDEHPDLIAKRLERVRAERASGKKVSEKSSNNFNNAIVHHRFGGPLLQLEDVATLWQRP